MLNGKENKNSKTKQISIVLSALLAVLITCDVAFAQRGGGAGRGGSSGRGGGTVLEQKAEMIRLLLAPGTDYLKKSLVNYLDTISVDQISDPTVRAVFSRENFITDFRRDVSASPYQIGEAGECRDHEEEVRSASAAFGRQGDSICFDVAALAAELEEKNDEETMVRLAVLAGHEHVHHLQQDPQNNSARRAELEAEARAVAAYMQLTARISQVPVLQWQMATNDFRALNVEIRYQVEESLLNSDLSGRNQFMDAGSGNRLDNLMVSSLLLGRRPRAIARLNRARGRLSTLPSAASDATSNGRPAPIPLVEIFGLGCLARTLGTNALRITARVGWDRGYLYDGYGTRIFVALMRDSNVVLETEVDAVILEDRMLDGEMLLKIREDLLRGIRQQRPDLNVDDIANQCRVWRGGKC